MRNQGMALTHYESFDFIQEVFRIQGTGTSLLVSYSR